MADGSDLSDVFARVALLVTSFKRTASGRIRAVRGSFRNINGFGFAFRPERAERPIAGRIDIHLDSFATDTPERDANVIAHLFGETKVVSVTVASEGQILTSLGEDAWTWRGFVDMSLGTRIPIVAQLRRRRVGDRVEVSARLAHALDTSVTHLGFPFADFLVAAGVTSVIDRVELDVGIVFDAKASRRRVKVVIAGAGIAGLAAAQALVDAGCDVTVLEKERFCGGKLTSHVDEALGHTVEHGIHGVFPPYRNLVALWRDAGIDDSIFSDTDTVGVASPDGISAESFHEMSGASPLSLLEMLPRGVLRGRDLAASAAFVSRVYASGEEAEALDSETFQALLDRFGVSEVMQRYIMHPYVKNLSYARPDQVSASAACDALGYYLLENADNFKARWFDGGPQELVIDPWVAELAKRGVRFLTGTPVKFVAFEEGRFQGFATRAVIPARTLGSTAKAWTQRFGSRVLALRWLPDQKQLSAWDGLCTHAGCPLQPAGEHGKDGFRCDCHGGAFDLEGRVLRAPPTRDLEKLPVASEDVAGEVFWKVGLDGDAEGDGIQTADYGIVALDIEGARSVLSPSLLDLPSTRGISQLRTTPLMVLRMWFRGTSYAGPDSGFFQAEDLLDNFFVLSRFQREFREVEDFTIVECHIGDCAGVDAREDEDVLLQAARCLARYFPALGPDVLDVGRSRVLRHREGFTMFAPGDASRTPSVAASDRKNLFFAGDWVRSEQRSWFMERAAVTGIEAANNVLAREGYGRRPIKTAGQVDSIPKLMALPFRAGDALTNAYRALVDGSEPPPASASFSPSFGELPAFEDAAREPGSQTYAFTDDHGSGTHLVVARHSLAPAPLVDLAKLLPAPDLARVHPFVREFYADPSAFDVVARLHMSRIMEHLVRGGLSISPLYALGLVASRDAKKKQSYPVKMVIQEEEGRSRWDRFLVIDGKEVPLFKGHVSIVDGCLRESLEGHGMPVHIDLRARPDGEGVRFELQRGSPSLLFTASRISYTTHPTANGIQTVGRYQNRLLRVDGRIELEAVRSAARQRLFSLPAPGGVRLISVPPPDSARRRGSGG